MLDFLLVDRLETDPGESDQREAGKNASIRQRRHVENDIDWCTRHCSTYLETLHAGGTSPHEISLLSQTPRQCCSTAEVQQGGH